MTPRSTRAPRAMHVFDKQMAGSGAGPSRPGHEPLQTRKGPPRGGPLWSTDCALMRALTAKRNLPVRTRRQRDGGHHCGLITGFPYARRRVVALHRLRIDVRRSERHPLHLPFANISA